MIREDIQKICDNIEEFEIGRQFDWYCNGEYLLWYQNVNIHYNKNCNKIKVELENEEYKYDLSYGFSSTWDIDDVVENINSKKYIVLNPSEKEEKLLLKRVRKMTDLYEKNEYKLYLRKKEDSNKKYEKTVTSLLSRISFEKEEESKFNNFSDLTNHLIFNGAECETIKIRPLSFSLDDCEVEVWKITFKVHGLVLINNFSILRLLDSKINNYIIEQVAFPTFAENKLLKCSLTLSKFKDI